MLLVEKVKVEACLSVTSIVDSVLSCVNLITSFFAVTNVSKLQWKNACSS